MGLGEDCEGSARPFGFLKSYADEVSVLPVVFILEPQQLQLLLQSCLIKLAVPILLCLCLRF